MRGVGKFAIGFFFMHLCCPGRLSLSVVFHLATLLDESRITALYLKKERAWKNTLGHYIQYVPPTVKFYVRYLKTRLLSQIGRVLPGGYNTLRCEASYLSNMSQHTVHPKNCLKILFKSRGTAKWVQFYHYNEYLKNLQENRYSIRVSHFKHLEGIAVKNPHRLHWSANL